MMWVITFVAGRLGVSSLLSSLITYAIIAALAGGALWGYGAYKHHQGYSAGELHERTAWQKQRDIDIAAREAERKATQATIDRLTAELELDAHKQKDDRVTADLKKEQAATEKSGAICAPRKVARIINRAGR